MDELDKILRKVMKDKYPRGKDAEDNSCLSEELFAEYLGNLLDQSEKDNVEKHLAECESCLQKSIMFSRITTEAKKKEHINVPGTVTEEVKRLVREKSPEEVIKVVLEFGKNIIKVIQDQAGICTVPDPAVLSMRNSEQGEKEIAVARIRKEFDNIDAHISIERTHASAFEIVVKIFDRASGETLDDIRVNLISGERELASYLTLEGQASFKNLSTDTYTLEIYKGKARTGSVMVALSSST
jgi:hypothetical protein